MLGILPNKFRLLLKQIKKDDDTAFEEISKTLFGMAIRFGRSANV